MNEIYELESFLVRFRRSRVILSLSVFQYSGIPAFHIFNVS